MFLRLREYVVVPESSNKRGLCRRCRTLEFEGEVQQPAFPLSSFFPFVIREWVGSVLSTHLPRSCLVWVDRFDFPPSTRDGDFFSKAGEDTNQSNCGVSKGRNVAQRKMVRKTLTAMGKIAHSPGEFIYTVRAGWAKLVKGVETGQNDLLNRRKQYGREIVNIILKDTNSDRGGGKSFHPVKADYSLGRNRRKWASCIRYRT
ncbi:hypothetical protein IE53DRAFT_226660 [Violaceomyces palustris]|uniref:Uncharacterized protein n=1 Tax=Violaceomyces palustris TaxID=1673888 RepID=A0ACD0NPV5_9BASI|nr:hypothetical protein IE53DRAFT_226660 [Violaceomyces palustris]